MLLFSPPPRITVLIAYITAVSAAPVIPTTPDLTARTSTSYVNVNGLENFNVTATIVNAGDKTLKLFNDSRGVLDLFPENSFTVTTPSGSRPSFNGGSVNREPGRTMNLPILDHPGAFIVLAPSDSINATRNFPAAHSFIQSGTGDYSIEPSDHFPYVDADGTPKDSNSSVGDIAKAKRSGNLIASRHVHDKRVRTKPGVKPKRKFKHCSDQQLKTIKKAAAYAQRELSVAYVEIKHIKGNNPLKSEDRYTRWFGAITEENVDTVMATIEQMRVDISFSTYSYDCQAGDGPNIAEISPETKATKRIAFRKSFWEVGEERQSSEFLRMAGSLVPNTENSAYGVFAARQLAKTNPEGATLNLANYVTFIQNTPDPDKQPSDPHADWDMDRSSVASSNASSVVY